MTDQAQAEPVATENAPVAETEAAPVFPNVRRYFTHEQLADVEAIADLAMNCEIPVTQFDGEFAAGGIIAVVPITERVDNPEAVKKEGEKQKQMDVVRHVLVWPISSLETCLDKFSDEVSKLIYAAQTDVIAKASKQGVKDFAELNTKNVPTSLQDLIGTKDRARYKAYNDVCPPFVAQIVQWNPQRFAHIKAPILRQYCENAALASSVVPDLEAKGIFVKVIEKMKIAAENEGLNVEIFDEWLETRDQQELAELDLDVDLDTLFDDVA